MLRIHEVSLPDGGLEETCLSSLGDALGVHVGGLLPYQGGFPFDIIGDPKKELYKKFGVESSIFALLNPKVWPAMIKSMMAENKPKGDPEGGRLGLPADFLISADGKVVASFYGSHAFDQWDVDELLAYVQK